MPGPADRHANFPGAPDGPYRSGFSVTASDTVDFAQIAHALWIATAQTQLTIVTVDGTVLNLVSAPAGTLLRILTKRVNATGTAPGTGIIGLVG